MFDRMPVVAFSVFRATGASDLVAADSAKKQLAAIIAKYPNVTFALIDDAAIYTEDNYRSANEAAGLQYEMWSLPQVGVAWTFTLRRHSKGPMC